MMKKTKLGPQTLLFPMPATLVGATVGGKPNFMTAAWCAIAAGKPPSIAVGINKTRYTLEGIQEHGTFSINVPSSDMAKSVDFCGIYSGRGKDKTGVFTVFNGELKTAPLIEECPVNLECKVIHLLDLGSHTLVVGEIKETFIAEGCLTDGKPDAQKIDPLAYITGTSMYYRLGEQIAPAFQVGKE
jgi:flavin reductase (DIM6/NTAB) family NADH-FMN oxidoreductase RutF